MRSFTLIETIITVLVFSLILGIVCGFLVASYKVFGFGWQQAVAIEEARRGIETMMREIREARVGEDGSYPIVKAGDKEFVFFSDIDRDGEVERVRYFLGSANSGTITKECETSQKGGSCSVEFSDFLQGTLTSAQVKVSLKGDFGWWREYAEISADGEVLGNVCDSGCSDCSSFWQGTKTFDVTEQAQDGEISFLADATSRVDPLCPYSMKAKFEFSWEEEIESQAHQLKKGVIDPVGDPPQYFPDQEKITVLSSFVRNGPPIFRYFDENDNELKDLPARLKDTKRMEIYLLVNVNPERFPNQYELRSSVQLRNLKEN